MDKDQLIQKYYTEGLNQQEQNEFDRLKQTDPDFQSELAEYQDISHVVEYNQALELKNLFQQEEKRIQRTTVSTSTFRRNIMVLLVILLASIIFFIFYQKKPTTERLYASYYEVPFNSYSPVTRSMSEANIKTKAFLAYEQNNFSNAVTQFEELLKIENNPNVNLYYAVSLAESNQVPQAIQVLEQSIAQHDAVPHDVYWYLGLYHLKSGNSENAIEAFENFKAKSVQPADIQKAEEILEQLK